MHMLEISICLRDFRTIENNYRDNLLRKQNVTSHICFNLVRFLAECYDRKRRTRFSVIHIFHAKKR